jgi:nuclear autoantigenic sperm protein
MEETPHKPSEGATGQQQQLTPPTMSRLNFGDGQPGTSASGALREERLAEAHAKMTEGLDLRDDEPERAVQLLGEALELRVQVHGSEAPECASTYFHYGQLLFENAQQATDILGDPVRQAVDKRAAAEVQAAQAEEGGDGAGPSSAAPGAIWAGA